MARHNREGRGADQRGFDYTISYQPDWLDMIKVTRQLESGRQSTKTLFRNSGHREQRPGRRVRTVVTSVEQGLEFEVVVNDPGHVVKRVIVETGPAPGPGERGGASAAHDVVFTIDGRLPPER